MIEIIPAIDILNGKCVRLSQGDYGRSKIYNPNPLEVARMFEDWGIKRLHLVDLDGAKEKHIVNVKVLEEISAKTNLIIDFGGGIKSDEDICIAFNAGASMITAGSVAVSEPELVLDWLNKYGNDKIILGADHKMGKIAISGWTRESSQNLISFIADYAQKGIKKVICTDISRDGMLEGPSLKTYQHILEKIPAIELIASGGVSNAMDLKDLENTGVKAVIVGKAIYEEKITQKDISDFNTSL